MRRPCEACGTVMEALTARKRFCGSTCRARAHDDRARGAVREIQSPATAPGSLVEAVRAELVAAGQESSGLGRCALVLAARVETGEDPGSGLAALNRELRATLAEVLRGSTVSPVQGLRDELAERRAKA